MIRVIGGEKVDDSVIILAITLFICAVTYNYTGLLDKLMFLARWSAANPMRWQRTVLPKHTRWSLLVDRRGRLNAYRMRRLGASGAMSRKKVLTPCRHCLDRQLHWTIGEFSQSDGFSLFG